VSQKPNVLFLSADNRGNGDVILCGAGGELRGMPTPNLDKLADKELLFNQLMVQAV
jgi:arylsulfatase A-like enzyme